MERYNIMIQTKDDKKKEYEPFKIRSALLALDEYLRIFIIPQIPAGHKEYREALRDAMDRAWRAMYRAVMTSKRERQHSLLELKIELVMVETYLREIRDVCYRGREKRRLDALSARRFDVCAGKQAEVMKIVWGWIKNEDKKLDTLKSQKTTGLMG